MCVCVVVCSNVMRNECEIVCSWHCRRRRCVRVHVCNASITVHVFIRVSAAESRMYEYALRTIVCSFCNLYRCRARTHTTPFSATRKICKQYSAGNSVYYFALNRRNRASHSTPALRVPLVAFCPFIASNHIILFLIYSIALANSGRRTSEK